ncbi:4a-hydroxytetrahydrobiopterin dehydratase [Geomicrobium sp. JCM 19039]|uniref:4a-hydroxytetrahydrobiopterin dehydratase n=1 Tax=Geomicrobium sp. JCM 19039 TaxID=1460636 RepID=UPI00045F2BF2|nr:4a-hydroxytetrahydrobiopterin dehydratase [Geomicrobium sp. JCM 19039]GAK11789.1 pterin-4-alpha-carbinolamine dehydratase [Geomicrobium sp. JCM 19039]
MSTAKEQVAQLNGWELQEETIEKTYGFNAYLVGITFVSNVARYAEAVQHHPHVTIDHTNVTVKWTTVDQGQLTEKDIHAAQASDNLYASQNE